MIVVISTYTTCSFKSFFQKCANLSKAVWIGLGIYLPPLLHQQIDKKNSDTDKQTYFWRIWNLTGVLSLFKKSGKFLLYLRCRIEKWSCSCTSSTFSWQQCFFVFSGYSIIMQNDWRCCFSCSQWEHFLTLYGEQLINESSIVYGCFFSACPFFFVFFSTKWWGTKIICKN